MTENQLKRILSFPIRVFVVPLMFISLPIAWLFSQYSFKECLGHIVKDIKEMMME